MHAGQARLALQPHHLPGHCRQPCLPRRLHPADRQRHCPALLCRPGPAHRALQERLWPAACTPRHLCPCRLGGPGSGSGFRCSCSDPCPCSGSGSGSGCGCGFDDEPCGSDGGGGVVAGAEGGAAGGGLPDEAPRRGPVAHALLPPHSRQALLLHQGRRRAHCQRAHRRHCLHLRPGQDVLPRGHARALWPVAQGRDGARSAQHPREEQVADRSARRGQHQRRHAQPRRHPPGRGLPQQDPDRHDCCGQDALVCLHQQALCLLQGRGWRADGLCPAGEHHLRLHRGQRREGLQGHRQHPLHHHRQLRGRLPLRERGRPQQVARPDEQGHPGREVPPLKRKKGCLISWM
eukprot:m.20965 g.20965  ORF g.20965 m.20965 type:complete len:348 (-) comp8848_c0_seq1:369-1412(-)